MYHICAYEYAYHMKWYIYTHVYINTQKVAHLLHLITWKVFCLLTVLNHMVLLEHPETSISTSLQFHSFNLEYSPVYLCALLPHFLQVLTEKSPSLYSVLLKYPINIFIFPSTSVFKSFLACFVLPHTIYFHQLLHIWFISFCPSALLQALWGLDFYLSFSLMYHQDIDFYLANSKHLIFWMNNDGGKEEGSWNEPA